MPAREILAIFRNPGQTTSLCYSLENSLFYFYATLVASFNESGQYANTLPAIGTQEAKHRNMNSFI